MAATPISRKRQRDAFDLDAALDQCVGQNLASLPSATPALFKAFVGALRPSVRGAFLATHSPEAVVTVLREIFELASVPRARGVVKASVGNNASGDAVVAIVCMDDQAFVVDTAHVFLSRSERTYERGLHMPIAVTRDAAGNMVSLGGSGALESIVYCEASGPRVGDAAAESATLASYLAHAAAVVNDFGATREVLLAAASELDALGTKDATEIAAFVRWLHVERSRHFLLMGASFDGVADLGIQNAANAATAALRTEVGGAEAWPKTHLGGAVGVRKSTVESTVHRRGRLDEIIVAVGETKRLFLRGLFTFAAVTAPSRSVPVVRRMLDAVIARIVGGGDAATTSHYFKMVSNTFDSLPTEYLLSVGTDSEGKIAEMLELLVVSEEAEAVGSSFMQSREGDVFCCITTPRSDDAFSGSLQHKISEMLKGATGASYVQSGVIQSATGKSVLLHFFLTDGATLPTGAALDELDAVVRRLATPWAKELWSAFAARAGGASERANALFARYGRILPLAYTRSVPSAQIASDIDHVDALLAQRDGAALGAQLLGADLVVDEAAQSAQLRVYQIGSKVTLTALLPTVHHFGLSAIQSHATVLTLSGGEPVTCFIDAFDLVVASPAHAAQLCANGPLAAVAIPLILSGSLESDLLHTLTLTAGLSWLAVDVLRGLMNYCKQLPHHLDEARVLQLVVNAPQLCVALFALFDARLNPARLASDSAAAAADAAVAAARARVVELIDALHTSEEDKIWRMLHALVEAVVRTSAYGAEGRVAAGHGHRFALKLDSSKVPLLPEPRPLWEIYVHSRNVEGVHLRFGRVARGGLRWSDRTDFRTEVLALATTQQVKNVIIVPVGSKGGFYVHHAPTERAALRAYADECYKVFVGAMLDITCNVHPDGVSRRPPNVVCLDPEVDPYFVVAADKGTAHLSDTANAISLESGFWLGDAFASGGSNGYDHKKCGITARGAWVMATEHLARIGIDPATDVHTCAGIGDMGGDVFGNGLIHSPKTSLVAAFNHLHIFIDPTPNVEASYAERCRLFEAGYPSGEWAHYSRALISRGGGIFSRRDKSIQLSAEAQLALGLFSSPSSDAAGLSASRARSASITPIAMAPTDVIRAILKMDVYLLWNGGIGTYVKASSESDAEANDSSNDAVRINAAELRCSVVGEGGNLGMTQSARIEAALHGVKLNTDALDNSAGVDCSDHEVNLKILLASVARRDASFDTAARNTLLRSMTDEVCTLVLDDNRAHALQLTRDEQRANDAPLAFDDAIDWVTRQKGGRSRDALKLPTSAEIAARAARGTTPLTRPELAVLSGNVKLVVFAALVEACKAGRKLHGFDAHLQSCVCANGVAPPPPRLHAYRPCSSCVPLTNASPRSLSSSPPPRAHTPGTFRRRFKRRTLTIFARTCSQMRSR